MGKRFWFAARPEWSSFCRNEVKAKKRERRAEKAAQNKLLKLRKIDQQHDSHDNPVPTPRFESIFIEQADERFYGD